MGPVSCLALMEPFKFVGSGPKREDTAILGTFSALLVKYRGHTMSQIDKESARNTDVRVRRPDLSEQEPPLTSCLLLTSSDMAFFQAHLQKISDY